MIKTDVCIIGAGPGGCMAALRLAKDNVPFVIIDKQLFPRDKICGDALSGKVHSILKRISPDLFKRFVDKCKPASSLGIRIVTPGDYLFDVPFVINFDPATKDSPGYTLQREIFDAFMVDEVNKVAGDNLKLGSGVKSVKKSDYGFMVSTDKDQINAKIVIDAAGGSSNFDTDYPKLKVKPEKTALAVRAYYEGVIGCHPDNYIELYFTESILPGYFWIFPLPNGIVNVGLGMRKDLVSKNKISLIKEMDKLTQSHPLLAHRFKNAKIISKVGAYKLPLGNPQQRISGDNFMLVGDAAQLVDPVSGEGVGNAVYSAYIAAEQAISCLSNNKFDSKTMKAYDERIKRVLGMEIALSDKIQKLLQYPKMSKWMAKKLHGNKQINQILSTMFIDVNVRKKLINPFFMFKVIFNLK